MTWVETGFSVVSLSAVEVDPGRVCLFWQPLPARDVISGMFLSACLELSLHWKLKGQK
jgi:hypothetical protein